MRIAAREPIEDRLWSFAHLAAGKLRVDYRRVFEGAREYGGRGYAELVQDWLERIEFERAISEMGYKEATGGKRFRYVDDEDGGNA